jgi:hypothetical protein
MTMENLVEAMRRIASQSVSSDTHSSPPPAPDPPLPTSDTSPSISSTPAASESVRAAGTVNNSVAGDQANRTHNQHISVTGGNVFIHPPPDTPASSCLTPYRHVNAPLHTPTLHMDSLQQDSEQPANSLTLQPSQPPPRDPPGGQPSRTNDESHPAPRPSARPRQILEHQICSEPTEGLLLAAQPEGISTVSKASRHSRRKARNKTDSNGIKPQTCWYFRTAEGCRNGYVFVSLSLNFISIYHQFKVITVDTYTCGKALDLRLK